MPSVSSNGRFPNSTKDAALVVFLKECAKQKDLCKGSELHAVIIRKGSLNSHHILGSTLVNLYAKCGKVAHAQQIFDELVDHDVVSWTALITGYAQLGHSEEALDCFDRMQRRGFFPNAVTFACTLKACANIGAAERGIELHSEILRKGLLGDDIVLGNALMDMYFKSGAPSKARDVFDELPFHDVVSWNALITGYALCGLSREALDSFEKMQLDGILPDPVTLLCILPACSDRGASEKGAKIHVEIVKEGLLEEDCVLGTALIDMYAKCGALSKAQNVFGSLPVRDAAAWNALITGFADAGKHDIVFYLFRRMVGENMKPTVITFVVVLNACSQLGLVDAGHDYFESMSTHYGIIPTMEHYTCMVDLFGGAGLFEKAMEFIRKMPSVNYCPAWVSLLGSCKKWGNVKLGLFAFRHAVRLDRKSAVIYVYMREIFVAAGMQVDADRIEAMRLENEAWL